MLSVANTRCLPMCLFVACSSSAAPTDLVNTQLRNLAQPELLCDALSQEFLQPAADCCAARADCDPARDVWGEVSGRSTALELCLTNSAPNVDPRYYPPECETTVGEGLRVRTVTLPLFCDEELLSRTVSEILQWQEENVAPVADAANADICNPFGAALRARRESIEEGAAP